MRLPILLFTFFFLSSVCRAQTVTVSGECMTGSINLTKEPDLVDGKVAYTGTGTVMGVPGVAIAVFWIGAPDNVWVLAFDGQPYFQNTCNFDLPPGTAAPTCTWTEVTPGTCTGGTALSVTGTGTTLPVRFTRFTAQKSGATVQLTWTTASEKDNRGFAVQRSNDGNQWTALGFVNGAGTTAAEHQYQFTDATPHPGKNYYRLLQTDIDNKITVSDVKVVDFTPAGDYTLRQTGNGIYLLNLATGNPVELAVVDLSGRKLFTRSAAPGLQRVDISAYAKGMYLLQIRNGNKRTTEKLIKH